MKNKNTQIATIVTNIVKTVFILGLIFCMGTSNSFAEVSPSEKPLSSNSKNIIAQVEKYLNNINSFEANFKQQSQSGVAYGKFYIQHPRKFLWEYETPYKQLLVSTGSRIFFHDDYTQQTTQLPSGYGIANLLTQNKISLDNKDLKIVKTSQQAGIINITLEDTANESGFVRLSFQSKPMQLKAISLISDLDEEVIATFYDIQEGHKLSKNLFNFVPAVEIMDD